MKEKYSNYENFLKSRGIKKASREEMKTILKTLTDYQFNYINYGLLRKGNDNQLYVLIYTAKKNKSWKEPKVRLSMIRSTAWKGTMWNWNLVFTQIMGYHYDFKNEEASTEKTVVYTDKWQKNMYFIVDMVKWQNMLEAEEATLKYVPNLIDNLRRYFSNDIIKGIKTFLEYPHQCEMLIKSGYPDYLTNTKMLKKPLKEITKYIKYAEESGIKYSDVLTISWNMKNHKSPKNALPRSNMKLLAHVMNELTLDEKEAQEVIDYVTKQHHKRYGAMSHLIRQYVIDEYCQYLSTRKALGMDNHEHSARFPSDFEEAFNELRLIKARLEDEKKAKEIESAKESLEQIQVVAQVKSKTYSVYHPVEETQFIALGNVMSNCVGRCGYYSKQQSGNCSIYAIKKDGEYYACLEVVPNENGGAKIKQLYLPHNIECDEKTRLFIVTNLLPLFSSGELKFENKLTAEEVSC